MMVTTAKEWERHLLSVLVCGFLAAGDMHEVKCLQSLTENFQEAL